ncbi:MAG: DUF1801 domain-containing protein [Parvularculaceae bacterium]|nr:DUF1801 domain-containing protein [Parvularculaceae bacterium]
MSELFRLSGAVRRDPAVDAWFWGSVDGLRLAAKPWFDLMRSGGGDVCELLHDGRPTACVVDVAFGYVDAFRGHANVGFYNGAALSDPARLLQGTGKRMRHVKLRPGTALDADALAELIAAAYEDAERRRNSAR